MKNGRIYIGSSVNLYNRQHKHLFNLHGKFGSKSRSAKAVCQYSLAGEYINTFGSVIEAAQHTGVHKTYISSCCNGKIKKTGGFRWYFITTKKENN